MKITCDEIERACLLYNIRAGKTCIFNDNRTSCDDYHDCGDCAYENIEWEIVKHET